MKKTLLATFAILVAATSSAETYSKVSTIKGFTVGAGMIRVQLADSTAGFEPCATEQQGWYYIDLNPTNPGMKEMYAALLAAKSSGQNVSLQLSGCASGYSIIKQVYVCDALFCP